jgi:hypothetical protein
MNSCILLGDFFLAWLIRGQPNAPPFALPALRSNAACRRSFNSGRLELDERSKWQHRLESLITTQYNFGAALLVKQENRYYT